MHPKPHWGYEPSHRRVRETADKDGPGLGSAATTTDRLEHLLIAPSRTFRVATDRARAGMPHSNTAESTHAEPDPRD